jgi:hydrophobic/amphiphilic exporter-1 (mainly G- bacteria), HAE1 family
VKLSEVSINRPVFATMIIGAIVLFGAVLYKRLSVDMYPDVSFPTVTVTVVYPGAGPETMESQIAKPIEEAVNSLSGIKALRSTSLEAVATVILEFNLDKDVAVATQEVRDRIATVQAELPDGIEAPLVQKFDLGASPVLQLAVSGGADGPDGSAQAQLLRYAEDQLKPALERIDGVGGVDVVGGREREMHVWLRPEALRGYELTAEDVTRALAAQNLEVPGGRIAGGGKELVVRTDARARTAEEIGALALVTRGGTSIQVRDVATVEDGFVEQRSLARVDGKPAVAVVLRKQSDANTVKVADAIAAELPALRAAAPAGATIEVLLDNSRSIRGSIDTVELDLVLGAVLAVAIIFLFLRDPRATIISALALPTSVIGTFAFVKIMGFSLNMMTTLALSLSIGILIDDAIVVIENIVRRRSALGEDARTAASRGTAEIGLAVLATTLSIVAVFVPVAFMDGMLGQFFYEFGLTVAFAVLLSLFVSFTLTPMLSSRFLAAEHGEPRGLSALIERFLVRMEDGYRRVVRWALHHRAITMTAAVATLFATFALVPRLGFAFTPPQDTGQFAVKMELPPGTSLAESDARVEQVAAKLRAIPGVTSAFATIGGGAQEKVNTADILVTLVAKDQRTFSQQAAMARARELLAGEPNALIAVEPLQVISMGGGRNAAVQLNLRGDDLEELAKVAHRIADRMRQTPGYVDVDTTYRGGKPQLDVVVDRAAAANLGVTGAQIATTVRSLLAGTVATQVENGGDRYDVRVQLPERVRDVADPGQQPQLRTSAGALVDLRAVAQLREGAGPSQIDREGRQRQISILSNLGGGKALSDAMTEVAKIAAEEAPASVKVEFGGSAKALGESMASMMLALFLAVACIYMILAAQFESFVHPFTIMSAVPFSLIGAFGSLLLFGMHMSIFAMIGLIMLMGLVTKNGILLVDFANQRRQAGDAPKLALENAGATRLRPILMTTAAMIFGMLPVAIGHGEGGEVRAPMGVSVIGGLITSTILTLVVVPVIYSLVDGMIARAGRLWRRITGGKPALPAATVSGEHG